MTPLLDTYLSKFESIIDPDHVQKAEHLCREVFAFREVEELPYIVKDASHAPDTDWPSFPYNDAFHDPAKMLLNELRDPFLHHQLRDYRPVNMRCNYGTVILPSLFDVPYRLTETSLPWTHHLGSRDEIRALIARGIPDIHSGLGGRIFETAHFYRSALADYPKLSEAAALYHPDLQGPFDAAHLIWGADIFTALHDCPHIVHELLSLIIRTYCVWMNAWKDLTGEGNDFITHWSFYMKGGILLRDDSAVMISPGQYEEFVKPYDQILLDEFTGGIHFCGCGNHFVPLMSESSNLLALHVSQPELNDMDVLWDSAVRNRIIVLDMPELYVPEGTRTGVIVQR